MKPDPVMLASRLTKAQIRAIMSLEPRNLYNASVMHGVVRESLWNAGLIAKLVLADQAETRRLKLTVLGCDVQRILQSPAPDGETSAESAALPGIG